MTNNLTAIASQITEVQEKIGAFEVFLSQFKQYEFEVKHTFTDGVYAREIFLPKDSMVVGKIHRHDHLNFISKGRVTVYTKDGLRTYQAPCTMVSTAGTKRAVYAHEDTVWTTIHANPSNETDLSKIEDFVIAKNYKELL